MLYNYSTEAALYNAGFHGSDYAYATARWPRREATSDKSASGQAWHMMLL
jgi:hypothetical protein